MNDLQEVLLKRVLVVLAMTVGIRGVVCLFKIADDRCFPSPDDA